MPADMHEEEQTNNQEQRRTARTLFWIGFGVGLAALGGALAYAAMRVIAANARGEDPTTARIQELIDEANSLLKALDEQRHSA
jgi:F0F1-type ATP synthase membrane subunit c/vacuolar-type H+-ATPase subunit K